MANIVNIDNAHDVLIYTEKKHDCVYCYHLSLCNKYLHITNYQYYVCMLVV